MAAWNENDPAIAAQRDKNLGQANNDDLMGQSAYLFPWAAAAQNDPANRALWQSLDPKSGEDIDAYIARLTQTGKDNPQIAGQITRQVSQLNQAKTSGSTTPWGKQVTALFAKHGVPGGANGAGGAAQGPLDRNKAVDDFYRMMMDPNAPELKAAQEQASLRSEAGMQGRGIGGGVANASVARAGMDSRNALQFQRQAAGISALQGGMSYDLNKSGQLFDQNQSNQINAANRDRALMQAGVAASGQIISGVADYAKSRGKDTGATGGGATYESPAAGMTLSYGGVGSTPAAPAAPTYGGATQPSNINDWNKYPGSGI